MYGVILGFHLFIAVILIAIILMQQREGGLSSVFGGGQSVFGGRGAAPFLTKTTIVLFILFILTSFTLIIIGNKRVKHETAIDRAIKQGEMAPNPSATERPAGNLPGSANQLPEGK